MLGKEKNSHLVGSFTAIEGQKLMFTIPYDEGWDLLIDGKESELKKVLGVFMEADIEAGDHTYEMRYVPSGLENGIVTSIVGVLLTILWLCINIKKS